jgi:hypothetical protein
MQEQALSVVYLIHFDQPYYHARHYLGTTYDLEHRLAQHALGRRAGGARLMEVITQAGITWRVACLCLAVVNLSGNSKAGITGVGFVRSVRPNASVNRCLRRSQKKRRNKKAGSSKGGVLMVMHVLPCGCRYHMDSSFCPEGRRLYEEAFYANYVLEHSTRKNERSPEEEARLQADRDEKVKAYFHHMGWQK